MEVGVRVDSEDVRTGEASHSSSAYLTMVAIDERGLPVEVPALQPETEEEHRREQTAQLRRENRLAEREAIRQARASGD